MPGAAAMAASSPPAFVEASAEAGLVTTHAPIVNGALPHVLVQMIGGGAVGDFDRDGDEDVFVLSGGMAPDRLFINDAGVFVDQAAAWGVDAMHFGLSACVGDVDGDGWLDIVVMSFGAPSSPSRPVADHHRLYRNNGDGTFTDVADTAGIRSLGGPGPRGWGAALGDIDLDGDLDLAVASWTGGGNRLFANAGDGTFLERPLGAALPTFVPQSFSPVFVDMDGDRYPELLVAGDFHGSQYFRNDRDGTFTDVTAAAGVGLDANGMGHVVADLDRDGRLDWFVTSIHTLHGFPPNIPGTGNFRYHQTGPHQYAVAPPSVTDDGGWGWGVEAIDVDHDGWIDLMETNGHRGTNAKGEFEWLEDPNRLYHNRGPDGWAEIAADAGCDWAGQGRGLLRLDADLDGDQDVIVFANGEPLRYFRNELAAGPDTRWIRIRLDTSAHPRLAPDGYGTALVVIAGGRTHVRQVTGGSTYSSQSELAVHVGLGSVRVIDELRVHWNDGSVTVLHEVAPDQHLLIASGFSSDLDGDGAVGFLDLLQLLARYLSDDAAADLDASGIVDEGDILILLGNWGLG